MRRYNFDILGISECHWTGSGWKTTNDGSVILYSGCDDSHIIGFALIMRKEVAKSLSDRSVTDERALTLSSADSL